MQKIKIILTDSNTLKQIRPLVAETRYRRFSGSEIKDLITYIESLEKQGVVEIENKIKRDGNSYGLLLATGAWYPAVDAASEAMVDVPYGAIAINISVANSTNKLDINDRENWDKGMFDLEARVMRIEKTEITYWKELLFPEFMHEN